MRQPRRAPRPLGAAVRETLEETRPHTLLAAVQGAWTGAAGERIAREATPVSEREGTVTIACRSATWAQELDLMQDELRRRLNERLEGLAVTRLRFTADAHRHDPPKNHSFS
jgi:predicted nucleic acid-binding Zn ribbon protein